jgi:3D (Asp-Asp-Asp) domain-containing protein/peptidoglycan hydrolase CwlO-like protein
VARRRVSGRPVAVLTALCAVLLAIGVATIGRAAEADEQRAVLADLRAGEESALLDLFAADSALARAERRVEALQGRLAAIRARSEETRRSLSIAQDNLVVARQLLNERLEQWYRMGEIDTIEIFLASDSFSDVIDQIDAIERMTARDAAVIEGTRAYASETEQHERALAEQERLAQSLVRDAQAEAERLAQVKSAKEALLADLRSRADLTEERIARLDQAAQEARARAEQIAAEQAASGGGQAAPAPDGGDGEDAGAPPPPPDAAPVVDAGGGTGGTLVVQATAYAIHGTTASGLPTAPGVCATDPSVIPMGTRFTVPGYGTCVAADTGSAIVGNIIDVWFPSLDQARAWGRQTVTVTLLG